MIVWRRKKMMPNLSCKIKIKIIIISKLISIMIKVESINLL